MTPDQRALRDALAVIPGRMREAAAARRDADDAQGDADAARSDTAAPATGEWSAREVTLHLAAVEADVWQPRLAALQAEAHPRWPWVEPGQWSGPGDDTLDGALGVHARLRAATVASLDALDDAGWARRGVHATFGELDVAALMRIALDHDEEHLAQIAG